MTQYFEDAGKTLAMTYGSKPDVYSPSKDGYVLQSKIKGIYYWRKHGHPRWLHNRHEPLEGNDLIYSQGLSGKYHGDEPEEDERRFAVYQAAAAE